MEKFIHISSEIIMYRGGRLAIHLDSKPGPFYMVGSKLALRILKVLYGGI